MDEVILRFPHLGVQIFQELDVGSLLNCKQVGRSWENFIETEKPLNDKFVIMRLVYGYWKALPKCLDWVENNFDFIMNKFKRRGIRYNISYMRIIIPRYLKNLQSETEYGGKYYRCSDQCPGDTHKSQPLWHYRLGSFKSRDTKSERFLPKNQHTQSLDIIEF